MVLSAAAGGTAALPRRGHWLWPCGAQTGGTAGPCCAGMAGPALQSQHRLGASLAVSGSWDTPCPWPGRAPSRSGADTLPPGPVPTPCWAVSSPPSKSVTHSASHIPQLQEIQNASVPAFLQPHMPPPCLPLKYFSCSRASLLLAFFSRRGKKPPSFPSSQL